MLLLDSGNFSDNPTPVGDLKTAGLLQAMERLGYRVINVGERDIRMGYPDFARRTAGTPFSYVSANIIDRQTKEPIFDPHVVVEVSDPDGKSTVRVGVIGAVRFNPMFLKSGPNGGNIVIEHPLERVKHEVEALQKKKVDLIVLLAALHKRDALSIMQGLPEIDFVLGSYGGLVTPREEKAGDATLMYCGNRGQRIGESRIFFDKDDRSTIEFQLNKLHVLSRVYPADQDMLNFVNSIPREAPTPAPATSSLSGESSSRAARPGS
jgi:2',3'-cyclic-nucleotide 2'-phosphodiesterase (5'-nucleotidase family)